MRASHCVYVWPAASPSRHHVRDSPLVAQPSSQGYCAITYAIVRLASFQPLHASDAPICRKVEEKCKKEGRKNARFSFVFFLIFLESRISYFSFFFFFDRNNEMLNEFRLQFFRTIIYKNLGFILPMKNSEIN